jgi:hypothetical protein
MNMAEREAEDIEEKEGTRRRKKAQPVYDQLKEGAESEDSQAKQGIPELPMTGQVSLINDSQGAQRAEAMIELQQTHGNRYVQRLVEAEEEATLDEDIVHGIKAHRGSGKLLAPEVRSQMEAGFGHDFGDVRVHADAEADKLSRDLGAEAFTAGKDVFFKAGAYEPGSKNGKRLIGHELTHVVQQGGAAEGRKGFAIDQNASLEKEANEAGRAIADEQHLALQPAEESPAIQAHPDDGEGRTSLSLFRKGRLGLHLTINAPPPPPEIARLAAPFRERNIPMTDRDVKAITAGRAQCEEDWTRLLRSVGLGPRSAELASWIAEQTYKKAIQSTLRLENPTVLEEVGEEGERARNMLRELRLPAAEGESTSGGVLDLLRRIPVGVSLTVHFRGL